jgi:TolB protein
MTVNPRRVAALLVVALVGACAGDGDGGGPPTTGTEPGATARAPAPAAHATEPVPETPPARAFAGEGVVAREPDPRERRFRNLRQVTFEGENAEAYWSSDGKRLVFQHRGTGVPADQIYVIGADGRDLRRVSTGTGRTTCAFFLSGDREVLFASTHAASPVPPPPPDRSRGYAWAIRATFDIFAADLATGALRRLTDAPGYDAEAVLSPDGKRVLFTSMRGGDLDLWTMDTKGGDARQVTRQEGYDGGAFFSPDGKRIVYRAHHPAEGPALDEYRELRDAGLVRPSKMEIFTCAADGSDRVQVTRNGAANFAPYFHPDGKRILFASNRDDPRGREFDLYLVGADGSGLERVTFAAGFDGFPMFSPDGKTLAFCSNRHGARHGETNLFLADWVE